MRWLGSRPRLMLALGLAAVWTSAALMQLSAQGGSLFDRFKQMSIQAEANGLAEPFKGVTTHGTPRPGLFTVKATGVSTAAVQQCGRCVPSLALRHAASPDDLPGGRSEWRKWMNQHFYVRQGVSFQEMTEPQREAAFALMRRLAQREGAEAVARHHEAESHARRS